MSRFKLFLVGLGIIFLSGCGFVDYFFLAPPEDTAQELAQAGYDAMQEKDYDKAIEYFTKLKDRYPFSPYTPQAEINLGDAYFLIGEYKAASETYKEFEALHPRHEAIPYVLLRIGLANLKQFESADRPYTNVAEAYSFFTRLIETYPQSEYAKEAKKYLRKCRFLMAEHELYVADFYWRTEEYKAAWLRYQYVEKEYQDLPEVVSYAKKRKELAYLRWIELVSKETKEREEGSWKRFLDWL